MKLLKVCVSLATVTLLAPAFAQDTAFGRPGDSRSVTRTIDVDMTDNMKFTPSRITVREGDTIRFNVKNSGRKRHEMVIGTMQELKEHAEVMRKHRGMKHDAPYMAHVSSGQTGQIVWQFTKSGKFNYGCLVRNHFEDGMYGEIVVTPK